MVDMRTCPWCSHSMDEAVHDPETGCLNGWRWDEDGVATKLGCDCPLTLASERR